MKIDLSKLPDGTKWIAIDSDGDVFAFADEPDRKSFFAPYISSAGSSEAVGNVLD